MIYVFLWDATAPTALGSRKTVGVIKLFDNDKVNEESIRIFFFLKIPLFYLVRKGRLVK